MTVTRFANFPLADRDREWDGTAAEKRVRKHTGAEDAPNADYRAAHIWYDADKAEEFTAYKLLIADVVNGKLEAVPHGIFAAAVVVDGGRSGLSVPDDELPRIRAHLGHYYDKLNEDPPWNGK